MKKLILLLSFTTFINCLFAQRIDSIEYNRGGGASGLSISFRYHHSAQFKSLDRLHVNYVAQKKIEKADWNKIIQLSRSLISKSDNYYKSANFYTSLTIYSSANVKKYIWPTDAKNIPETLQNLTKCLLKYQ
jgi:hypothetical protein